MLADEGRQLFLEATSKILGTLVRKLSAIDAELSQRRIKNAAETGKKSIKSLVKLGGELEMTEEIKSKEHLKLICQSCKSKGLAFALKKTKDNGYRVIYQRRNAALFSEILNDTLNKTLNPKPKLLDVFKKITQAKQRNIQVAIKHKEVEVR